MDMRKRILGQFVEVLPDGTNSFAASDFILRLLLFEKLTIQSNRFIEIAGMVEHFGFEPVLNLLKTKDIDVQCDARGIGQTGQLALLEKRRRKGVLPLGSYSFSSISIPDREDYIHRSLQNVNEIRGLPLKQAIKLKQALVGRLLRPMPEVNEESLQQLRLDLAANVPIIKTAISHAIRINLAADIKPSEFECKIHQIDDEDFRVDTNLSSSLALSEEELHKLIEGGLLSVSRINNRIAEMKHSVAMTGFRDEEIPLFEEKLHFIQSQISSLDQEARFHRITAILGFQDLDVLVEAGKVDLNTVLEVRESKECREFREWLWSVNATTEAELEERIRSLRERLSWFAHGKGGKTLRWVASTGIGMIPFVGTAAGAAFGFLDTFLLEKALPQTGALTFLSKSYPSIFNEDPRITPENYLKSL